MSRLSSKSRGWKAFLNISINNIKKKKKKKKKRTSKRDTDRLYVLPLFWDACDDLRHGSHDVLDDLLCRHIAFTDLHHPVLASYVSMIPTLHRLHE
jgi:hypothetical protein